MENQPAQTPNPLPVTEVQPPVQPVSQPVPPISQPVPPTPLPVTPIKPKRSFSLKWLLVIIFVLILIAAIPVGAYFLTRQIQTQPAQNANVAQTMNALVSPTATPAPVGSESGVLIGQTFWNVKRTNLTPTELEIKNVFASYVATSSSGFNNNRRLGVIDIFVSTISANFASADVEAVDQNDKVIPTGGWAYYLYKTNGIWHIMTGGENNYCSVIKTFPSDLLTENLKTYLVGCFPK